MQSNQNQIIENRVIKDNLISIILKMDNKG